MFKIVEILLHQGSVDRAKILSIKLHLQFYLLMITNGLHNLDVMVKQLPFAFELKKGESRLIASNFSSLYKSPALLVHIIIIA